MRGIIVEDSLGRPRVVLGAPMPIPGRASANAGSGIAFLSPSGKLRVAIGAPVPAPRVAGKVVERMGGDAGGGPGGLILFDTAGDERGGLGVLPNDAANICLDYAHGARAATCMVVAPGNEYAGLTINGMPGQGYERASMVVTRSGDAQVKVSAINGQERAILRAMDSGPAQLLVRGDSAGRSVNVLPSLSSPGARH